MQKSISIVCIITILTLFSSLLHANAIRFSQAKDAVRLDNISRIKLLFPDLADQERGVLLVYAANQRKPVILKYLLKQGVDPDSYNKDGSTALLTLSHNRKADIKTIKLLIKYGADVNLGNNNPTGRRCETPLKQAVNFNRINVVQLLIKHGVKIDQQLCKYDPTALQIAAKQNWFEIIELLLKHGADPNLTGGVDSKFNALDKLFFIDKPVPAEKERALSRIVILMLDKGANVNRASLFGAARMGYAEILDVLLEKESNPGNLNEMLWTAQASGHNDVVSVLKKYGAVYVPRYAKKKNITGKEAIDFALELRIRWDDTGKTTQQHLRELHDLVKSILKSEPHRPRLWYLDSQIYCYYARWRSRELTPDSRVRARIKIKNDALLNNYSVQCSDSLKKALSLDQINNSKEPLTRFMLLSAGSFQYADAEARVAAIKRTLGGRHRNIYEEQRLKGEYKNFFHKDEYFNHTVYDSHSAMVYAYASHSRFQEAIELIDKQIELFPGRKDDLHRKKQHLTIRYRIEPILEAHRNGQALISKEREPLTSKVFQDLKLLKLVSEDTLNKIKEKGINARINVSQDTLLNSLTKLAGISQEDRTIPYIILLINAGADISIGDKQGRLPIHNAARRRNYLVLSALMEQQENINVQDNNGATPLLHVFSGLGLRKEEENNVNILGMLLRSGADPNLGNNRGDVSIMFVSHPVQEKHLSLLLKHGANLNIKNNNGVTSLMMAALANNVKLVEILLGKGADHDVRDNSGHTALERVKIAREKELESIKRWRPNNRENYKKLMQQLKMKRLPIIQLLEEADNNW